MHNLCVLGGCTKFAKVHQLCLLHYRMKCIVDKASSLKNHGQANYARSSSSSDDAASPCTRLSTKNRKCKVEGCSSCARRYGLCSRHGGSKVCNVEGCSTPAQTGGRCRAHGGGTLCKTLGCSAFARFQGHCSMHSSSLRQPPTGCSRFAKAESFCLVHARDEPIEVKTALLQAKAFHRSVFARSEVSMKTVKTPTRQAIHRELFKLNGPRQNRLCQEPGCASYARRRGRCSRHGGFNTCNVMGCTTPAQTGGRCRLHGGGSVCKVLLVHGCTRYAKIYVLCLIHSRANGLKSEVSNNPVYHHLDKPCAMPRDSVFVMSGATSPSFSKRSSSIERKAILASRACKVVGCYSYARRLGRCSRHGGSNECQIDGCTTPAQSRGLCRMHGGGTLCKTKGCPSFARVKGHCSKHSPLGRKHTKRTGSRGKVKVAKPKTRPGSVPAIPAIHTLSIDDHTVIARNSAPAAVFEDLAPSPPSSRTPSSYSESPSRMTASEQIAQGSGLVGSSTEISAIGLAGFLNMREHGPGIHRMKRYYCRLVGVLLYRFYTRESSRDLSNAHMEAEVQRIEEWDGKGMMHLYRNAFRFSTSQATYNVAADSESEKVLWTQYALEAIDAAQLQMRDAALLPQSQSLLAASPGGLTLIRPNKEKEKPPKFKGQPTCAHPKCTVRFDNTKRQHHCRNCGDSVCSDHSYHFAPLPHLPTLTGPQRQCTRCFRVHRFIQLLRCVLQVFVKNRHQRNSPRVSQRKPKMTTEDVAMLQTVQEAINEPDFGVSDAIQALHLHRKDSDEVYRVIVLKLLTLSASHMPDFEFFLPQLFHLWASTEYDAHIVKWTLLLRLLMTAATYHVRLATSIHWLMRATIDDSCGWGFGQSELSIPEYLKNRFAPSKLALYNLHMLVHHQDGAHAFTFAPDTDLRTMPIQTDLIQTYFDRLLALQQYDEGLNAITPDFLPSPARFFPAATPSNGSANFGNSALVLGPIYAGVAGCVLPADWSFPPVSKMKVAPRHPTLEQNVFTTQLAFIDRLGEVAEALRFLPPKTRKEALPEELAKLSLPEHAFYPLGTCDEPLRRLVAICLAEGAVFTTKARAPTMVWFEVENLPSVPETLWLTPAQSMLSEEEKETAVVAPPPLSTSLGHDEIGQVLRTDDIMSSLHHIEKVQPLSEEDEEDDESVDGSVSDVALLPVPMPLSGLGSSGRMRRSGSLCSSGNPLHLEQLIQVCDDPVKSTDKPRSKSDSFQRQRGSLRLELMPTDAEKPTYEQLETIAMKMMAFFVAKPAKAPATKETKPHDSSAAPMSQTAALGRITVEAIAARMGLHVQPYEEVCSFSGKECVEWMQSSGISHNEAHALWLGSELLTNELIEPVNVQHHDDPVLFTNDDATLFVCTVKPDDAGMSASTILHTKRGTTRYTSLANAARSLEREDTDGGELVTGFDRLQPEKTLELLRLVDSAILRHVAPEAADRDETFAQWEELQGQVEAMCEYIREKRRNRQLAVKSMFGEDFESKRKRLLASSSVASQFPDHWDCSALIVKSNDDLRQEVLCLQLIRQFRDIFASAELDLWLLPYGIIATSASTGIIEVIRNATSLSSLKGTPGYVSLNQHFVHTYGTADTPAYKAAMNNFVKSMAAYSLVCYILRIKDRHNGNIMLDSEGHLIHIDYGFILGIQPGGRFSLERRVPFKLTTEMVDAMGGSQSEYFREFVTLLIQGFLALRQNVDTILMMIAIMAQDSSCPCFLHRNPRDILFQTKQLFALELTPEQVIPHVMKLVRRSLNSFGYRRYDQFQHITNNIVPYSRLSSFDKTMASAPTVLCSFQRCTNAAESLGDAPKCATHRFRHKCSVFLCPNQVYARQLCVRHGGKRLCQHLNCTANARAGHFCNKHGRSQGSTLCDVEGCVKAAHLRRRCITHGGGKPCSVSTCAANARARGYCWRHRFMPSSETDVGPSSVPVVLTEAERSELVAVLEECLALDDGDNTPHSSFAQAMPSVDGFDAPWVV
ncbi:phosphatidylinositol kinase (PIK-G2) [Achlya hypogyna]|uniref:1-phosphatidylinositol 4-kinase n=1 Tax=Achlya hypogyna TaxID=1202772 RepID=A0A1V9YLT9_ACHHY|nr:phosphatidylinositol kinase (PIK-G2) [Achlya hypogyna]